MAKPKGNPAASAVMEHRGPAEKEGDDPITALHRKLDYFPTPPWGARAGGELVQALDPRCRIVREPACGGMHMAGPLQEYFEVWPSDVHAHGPNTPVRDWLDPYAWDQEPDCDWVITNPPFNIAHEFITLGLQRARRGVALLLRLTFLEGQGRYQILYGGQNPVTVVAPFCERIPMTLGKWDPKSGTATGYAWFLWMKDAPNPGRLHGIPPGTRKRLWKADDAERYGYREPMPLFEGVS